MLSAQTEIRFNRGLSIRTQNLSLQASFLIRQDCSQFIIDRALNIGSKKWLGRMLRYPKISGLGLYLAPLQNRHQSDNRATELASDMQAKITWRDIGN